MDKTLFDDFDEPGMSSAQTLSVPLTVSELNSRIKKILESSLGRVFVAGEASSVSCSKQGHVYFTLKDAHAQINAIIWRSTLQKIPFEIKNGITFFCKGEIEVYSQQGKYQLIVRDIQPQGIGKLELAFRQLHDKLAQEGLFDQRRKKPIPPHPQKIAVITSLTGAALRDFFNILHRRSRRIDLLVYPVLVQGENASQEIEKAFSDLNALSSRHIYNPDLIVLIRGGGSMEDLWTFNEEKTVRAIAASQIPVVTGIGHEIDNTLSDFAADLHCLTPSDAAGQITPDDSEIPATLGKLETRLSQSLNQKLSFFNERINRIEQSALFTTAADRILGTKRMQIDQFERNLDHTAEAFLLRNRNRIGETAAKLETLSPLGVLARGYSITMNKTGEPLRRTDSVHLGETITTRIADGEIRSSVTDIIPSSKDKEVSQ